MGIAQTFRTLGRHDLRLVGRDGFLIAMFAYVMSTAIAIRLLLPRAADFVAARPELGFRLETYYALLIGYAVLYLGAMVVGMITGFVTIDERDQNTLQALLVTPLSPPRYLMYRVGVSWLAAVLVCLFELIIMNFVGLPFWQMLVLAMGGALTAPVIMLVLASLSENKVQGFATMKIIGGIGLLFFGAWFVSEPVQYLFGLFPPYWGMKAYWLAAAGDSDWWGVWLIGVMIMLAVNWLCARWFSRVAYDTKKG